VVRESTDHVVVFDDVGGFECSDFLAVFDFDGVYEFVVVFALVFDEFVAVVAELLLVEVHFVCMGDGHHLVVLDEFGEVRILVEFQVALDGAVFLVSDVEQLH